VPLFFLAIPTNTWKLSGLGFNFPTNLILGPNQLLLLVANDPATFRAKYSVPGTVPVLGPFAGLLQDDGETLELQRPDTPNTNGIPYITVEAVRYSSLAPWPEGADGTGASLQRLDARAYGNDPGSWFAAAATPGIDNTTSLAPELNVGRSGGSITLWWDPGSAGDLLESADQIPAGSWLPVSGVANNSVTVTPAGGSRFYRLRKL